MVFVIVLNMPLVFLGGVVSGELIVRGLSGPLPAQ